MNKEKITENKPGLLQQLAQRSGQLFNTAFGEQCAALCYQLDSSTKGVTVLLVTSRESGRWVIPKGWLMKGRKPHQAAEIEACEEAGVQGEIKKRPFGYFTYIKILEGGRSIPCVVSVYLLKVDTLDKRFREKGQRSKEWVTCEEAARRVREPELRGLFSKLRRDFSEAS